jgi:hypothetical protein
MSCIQENLLVIWLDPVGYLRIFSFKTFSFWVGNYECIESFGAEMGTTLSLKQLNLDQCLSIGLL